MPYLIIWVLVCIKIIQWLINFILCRKNLTMDEVHDIHGLRLIVKDEQDCYESLQIVHRLWSEVPGKLKDYIHQPKCNGYVICKVMCMNFPYLTLIFLTLVSGISPYTQ